MRRTLAMMVALLLLVLTGSAFAADVIKIGHTVSLTGGASMWGQSEARALDMLVKKINENGGVLGKKIEFVRYDNRNDAVESVNVARRLVSDGVAAVIGPAQSGNSIATAPVLEKAKIPMVVTTATNPYVTIDQKTEKVRPFAFRPCFIDPFQGTVAARFAITDLGARKGAILYDVGSDYGQWLAKYFEEAFTDKGGTIVAKEAFRTDELDYRAQLGKIKDLAPDVIFIPTSQKEAAMAAKQARDIGITATLLGTDNWGSPDLIDLGGSAIDGGYFVNLTDLADPDIQDFVAEYKAAFGEDPVLPNPVMAQDALIMIVEALKTAGTTDGEKLAEALANLSDIKVTSGVLTISPEDHNPLDKPAVIQQVDVANKTFKFVKKYVSVD
ncbi:MAG: ABC transporter substrate-binding protein [Thermovirgaceae bacterium]|nr:ABC transporter substrate-binding protein [Synergistales bacterium]MDI9391659.1 ABC transporter substrate-binding protein [Synergistota bacterium]MDY0178605.1 ABC transporter substrate-binding protein [Synergistaceae bacterium]HRW86906.1 ABC transporter substrate-binding protein [Thermovirgaceae bacterium]MDD3133850.1 ABC transporter substrate-binding protein [Synergistales bacterium]